MKWQRTSAGHYVSDTGCVVTRTTPPFSYSARQVWRAEIPGADVEETPLGPRHPTFMTLAKAKEHCEAQHEGR